MIVYVSTTEVEAIEVKDAGTVLDGMIDAQNTLGQITWHAITQYTAKGTYGYGLSQRVAVVDLTFGGTDALKAALWVHE